MVFQTKTATEAAKKCSVWVADATFEVAPPPFKQVYFIHGLFKPDAAKEDAEWVGVIFREKT